MIAAPALPCPRCKRVLEAHSWHDASTGTCRRCSTDFEFHGFPALTAGRVAVAPQMAVAGAESVCFFHPENRAEKVCEECGRLVCNVCAIPFIGRTLCPSCVSVAEQRPAAEASAVRNRVLWDSVALSVAVVPLFVFFITLVTAPVALGCVIYAWNKPNSLVRGRGRWRLVLAALVALGEMVGWALVFLGPVFRSR